MRSSRRAFVKQLGAMIAAVEVGFDTIGAGPLAAGPVHNRQATGELPLPRVDPCTTLRVE